MQFKVPQNIDMQDRIVGSLTLIQFLYLIGGGIFDYVIFTMIGTTFLFWLLCIPVSLFAVLMALVKIQDQPFSHFVKAAMVFFTKPQTRIWKRTVLTKPILIDPPKPKVAPKPVVKKQMDKSELEKLSHILDTQEPIVDKKPVGSVTASIEKILKTEGAKEITPANLQETQKS